MNTYVDWDVKTITAGDYSVEFDLELATYEKFQRTYLDVKNPMSENAQFKLYIQNELESRINAQSYPDRGYDDESEKHKKKKIAQITFAYENGAMIELLNSRGKFLQTEKWEKAAEVTKKIQDIITTDDKTLQ